MRKCEIVIYNGIVDSSIMPFCDIFQTVFTIRFDLKIILLKSRKDERISGNIEFESEYNRFGALWI